MTPSQAAQEKLTSPGTGQASPRPWKQDAMYVVAEVEGGRPGGEVIVQCRPTRSWAIHDEARDRANAALIVEAVNAYRREAAAATPSLRSVVAHAFQAGWEAHEAKADFEASWRAVEAVMGADTFEMVKAIRGLARLDEGSATPREQSDD